jgi:hypothetical protein
VGNVGSQGEETSKNMYLYVEPQQMDLQNKTVKSFHGETDILRNSKVVVNPK